MRLLSLRVRRDRRAGIRQGRDAFVEQGVRLDVAPGAQLVLGDGCRIGEGTRIIVAAGRVEIGPGAVLGERCTIVAHSSVTLGARAQLGHGALIVDFDHVFDDVERPIREQPLRSAPVTIGHDAQIGLAACILRGVRVGARVVVEPRAVVRRHVADGARVGGVPAKPLENR